MTIKQQSTLVKFLMAVSIILFATSVIGLVGMYKTQSVQGAQLDSNKKIMIELKSSHSKEIEDVKEYHNKDVDLIRDDIKEIKADQKIIMSDIKKLLIKTGGF